MLGQLFRHALQKFALPLRYRAYWPSHSLDRLAEHINLSQICLMPTLWTVRRALILSGSCGTPSSMCMCRPPARKVFRVRARSCAHGAHISLWRCAPREYFLVFFRVSDPSGGPAGVHEGNNQTSDLILSARRPVRQHARTATNWRTMRLALNSSSSPASPWCRYARRVAPRSQKHSPYP